ncbi:MAG: mannose-6-phosphate isomerase, class I [Ilumatobacteraceae bacterium]
MQRVHGVVQRYAWGDPDFIPSLLGVEPDGDPWAELWLGTHPSGPAVLDDGRPLAEVTGELPYLLKVLAAAEPLSLQVHPNGEQARRGFDRGTYADPNAKPELVCALTEFDALCGIRPIEATLALLDELDAGDLAGALATEGPHGVLGALYAGTLDPRPIIEACATSDRAEATVASRLAEHYPDDPSVVATLLLNLVRLAPGEALRLGAGNLHAYLHGAAIELMGPSDNVVRAGLTHKAVDVDELLRIADTTPLLDPVIAPSTRYCLDGGDIELVHLRPGDTHRSAGHELSIDVAGEAWYQGPGDERTVTVGTYIVTSRLSS